MEVIYSIGAEVGGSGIGYTAYNAIREIFNSDLLKSVFSTGNKSDIPSKFFCTYPYKFLINKLPYLVKNILYNNFDAHKYRSFLFDNWVKRKISDSDIFHGWNGLSLETIKKVKPRVTKIYIERASSHISLQYKLLKKEYKKNHIKLNLSNYMYKKSIKEYNLADKIVVPSEFVYTSFLDNGFDESKLLLSPFGVDSSKFVPDYTKKNKDKFRILFVGQIGFRKGVHYLLRAFKKINNKNMELVLIGKVLPEFKTYLNNFLKIPNIKHIGWSEDLVSEYQLSDIFVFPSIEEGSALVTYEAMACGIPVVTTYNSGSQVRNNKDGFIINNLSIKELSDKIEFFYEHRLELKRMGRRARKHIIKYTWEKYGKRIVKSYLTG